MLYWIAGPVAPAGGPGQVDRNQARLHYTPGVVVASVPWQLASSEGLAERDDVAAPGLLRRGATPGAEREAEIEESELAEEGRS